MYEITEVIVISEVEVKLRMKNIREWVIYDECEQFGNG